MLSAALAKPKSGTRVEDIESSKLLDDDDGPVCPNHRKLTGFRIVCIVLTMVLFVLFTAYRYYGDFDRKAADTVQNTAVKIQQESFMQFCSKTILHGLSLLAVTYVTLSLFSIVVPLTVCFVKRRLYNYSPKTHEQCVAAGMPCPEITVIIPCYLPNEKDIVEGTVEHVMNKLESPAVLKTVLVYNTPKDMPETEEKLRAMERRTDWKDGRQLQVIRVHSSKSKAENLNHVLSGISSDFFVIYDADHNPDPDSLMRMNRHMWEQDADVVQGSTYIRNLEHGLLAKMIDADFFVLFFGYYPSLAVWTQLAMFGGSNALIRKAAVGEERFSTKMQTEDIDLSLRLLLKNKNIVFCPEARSGELAPVSCMATYKQRLRWTIGWDQVSLHYFQDIVNNTTLSLYRKLCLGHWLYTRWVGQFLGVLLPFLRLLWISKAGEGKTDLFFIWMQNIMLVEGIVFCALLFLEALCQLHHQSTRQTYESVKQVGFVLVYYVLGPLNVYWQAFLMSTSMFKIFTGNAGNWVVTVRSSAKGSSAQAARSKHTGENTNLSAPFLGA